MKTARNPAFQYTPSYKTDVKKTFERVRRRLRREIDAGAPAPLAPVNIASLAKRKAGVRR